MKRPDYEYQYMRTNWFRAGFMGALGASLGFVAMGAISTLLFGGLLVGMISGIMSGQSGSNNDYEYSTPSEDFEPHPELNP